MSTLVFHVFAIAAVAAAVVAVCVAVFCWRQVRRLRAGHMVIFGEGRTDLVDFAVSLQARNDDLHQAVDEIAAALTRIDKRIDGTVENVAVVRYDAFGDRGGQQSATVALLDASRSGVSGTPNIPGQSIISNSSGMTSAANCWVVNGGWRSNSA